MSTIRKRIYLFAGEQTTWVERFLTEAHSRCDVVWVPPSQLSSQAAGEALTTGAVVLYESNTEDDTLLLERIRRDVRFVDLPVVVVANDPNPAARARFLASGACVVLDAHVEPETIVNEVEGHCDLEPVMQELRETLLEPFLKATQFTLQEMVGVNVTVQSVYRKQGYRIQGDYSAVVGLVARTDGTLVMSFPRDTAREIGRAMLTPIGVEPTEELIQSALAEVANIIVGRAKGGLVGTPFHFTMATPTIVSGLQHEIRYEPGLPCIVVHFAGDIGAFALQLCMGLDTTGGGGRHESTGS